MSPHNNINPHFQLVKCFLKTPTIFSSSGGGKAANSNQNIQQILIFFMFFKFYAFENIRLIYLINITELFSFFIAVCCRKLLLFSSHSKQKHNSEVEKNIRPDTRRACVTQMVKREKKRRKNFLMKIRKFNSSGFHPFHIC
jgi:hypothetical protein